MQEQRTASSQVGLLEWDGGGEVTGSLITGVVRNTYRLLSCELTGATVAVVESIDRGMQQYLGRRGTVVGESMNCLSVAFEAIESDRGGNMIVVSS